MKIGPTPQNNLERLENRVEDYGFLSFGALSILGINAVAIQANHAANGWEQAATYPLASISASVAAISLVGLKRSIAAKNALKRELGASQSERKRYEAFMPRGALSLDKVQVAAGETSPGHPGELQLAA